MKASAGEFLLRKRTIQARRKITWSIFESKEVASRSTSIASVWSALENRTTYRCFEGRLWYYRNTQKTEVTSSLLHESKRFRSRRKIMHLSPSIPCCCEALVKFRNYLLNSFSKADEPLHTPHLDHIGPLSSTRKQYKYLLVVIDGFTKCTWIFPTKSTGTAEVLDKLQVLQRHFGNLRRIITNRGPSFRSHEFQE